jgi:hypothetical protein
MQFEELFKLGLDRSLGQLRSPPTGLWFDIGGTGKGKALNGIPLAMPEWQFPRDRIPASNETVAILHCYHFLEHLSGKDAIAFLREAERVLMPGGILQYCIPHACAEIAFQDLDHKSIWTESSFRMLFANPYYDPSIGMQPWRLQVYYQVIAGVVQRNLCLLGQLLKV